VLPSVLSQQSAGRNQRGFPSSNAAALAAAQQEHRTHSGQAAMLAGQPNYLEAQFCGHIGGVERFHARVWLRLLRTSERGE